MDTLNGISRDLVHAARSLAKARAFTFVCVVTLGIGMTPVIFDSVRFADFYDAAADGEHRPVSVELVTTRLARTGPPTVVLSGLHRPARCRDRVSR